VHSQAYTVGLYLEQWCNDNRNDNENYLMY